MQVRIIVIVAFVPKDQNNICSLESIRISWFFWSQNARKVILGPKMWSKCSESDFRPKNVIFQELQVICIDLRLCM